MGGLSGHGRGAQEEVSGSHSAKEEDVLIFSKARMAQLLELAKRPSLCWLAVFACWLALLAGSQQSFGEDSRSG
jgi:hypothetical protein